MPSLARQVPCLPENKNCIIRPEEVLTKPPGVSTDSGKSALTSSSPLCHRSQFSLPDHSALSAQSSSNYSPGYMTRSKCGLARCQPRVSRVTQYSPANSACVRAQPAPRGFQYP